MNHVGLFAKLEDEKEEMLNQQIVVTSPHTIGS